MASVAKQRGRRFWYAVYRDATGRQHFISTKIEHSPTGQDPKARSKIAAENRRNAQSIAMQLEETERGNAVEEHLREVLSNVSERVNRRQLEFKKTNAYLREWAERSAKTKSWRTAERYSQVVDDFLASLGPKAEVPINVITARDIQKFIDEQTTAGKSATTVRIAAKVLNIPFNRAMRQGLILTNPVPTVELPSPASETREAFSLEQVNDLVKAAKGEWKTAIMLGAYTGVRLGDAVTMRWQNLDLQKRILRFRPSKTKGKKKDLEIPLHPRLHEELIALPSTDDQAAFIMPTLAAQKIPGRSGLSRQFQEIMAKAAIEQKTVEATGKGGRTFNRLSFHSLRHTFVSMLANLGIAPDVRRLLSGHADERAHTAYTHTELETLRKAIDALPRIDL